IMNEFEPGEGIIVLPYVDDLLVAGKTRTEVEKGTVRLLNYLGKQGLGVPKSKLQFVEKEVRYLGYIIINGGRKLSPERIKGILDFPLPRTKKEMRQFL
ncbi:POL2 protein, partial [Oxyruncus cristatus]|nr:POL2 protein [Oxyruncus cristatus]